MSLFDYSATHLFEDVPTGNTSLFRIKTGSRGIDVLVPFSSDGQLLVEVETEMTFSDGGTEETIYQRNEMNDNTTNVEAYYSPTVDTTGDTIAEGWIPGGGQGANKIGGRAGEGDTLGFKPDTEHLVKLTNTSGSDSDIFVKVLFDEV